MIITLYDLTTGAADCFAAYNFCYRCTGHAVSVLGLDSPECDSVDWLHFRAAHPPAAHFKVKCPAVAVALAEHLPEFALRDDRPGAEVRS